MGQQELWRIAHGAASPMYERAEVVATSARGDRDGPQVQAWRPLLDPAQHQVLDRFTPRSSASDMAARTSSMEKLSMSRSTWTYSRFPALPIRASVARQIEMGQPSVAAASRSGTAPLDRIEAITPAAPPIWRLEHRRWRSSDEPQHLDVFPLPGFAHPRFK